ncbi:hypothetical protein FRC01_010439 [Tulasnella sp. 417]|nr:hypothetical protein FRC01_010439 [Tulasnella sp. 417]
MNWGANTTFFQASELYEALKFSALYRRTFLFASFSENGGKVDPNERRLHELYARAKAVFDLVAPQEYGIRLRRGKRLEFDLIAVTSKDRG